MCKKLIVLLFVLAFVGSASAANMYFIGSTTDWFTQSNWGGSTALPTTNDWVDIRGDAWVANMPVINSGNAYAQNIRMGSLGVNTCRITVNGGSVTTAQAIYVGSTNIDGMFKLYGGTVNVGTYTVVGGPNPGTLRVNGGTLNAGYLMVPQTWGTVTSGHVAIDGGIINATGISVATNGSGTRDIQFTKNIGSGGGKIVTVMDMNDDDWDAFQARINANIAAHEIFSDVGDITVVYTTTGPPVGGDYPRQVDIYSTIPEPMSIALLGFGGLLLRRRRRS